MKTLISLYLFIIFFIAFIFGFIHFVPIVFPFEFSFNIEIINFIEVLRIILTILIFFKAHNLYSKTNDKKMAIIAGGFMAGSLLGMLQILTIRFFSYDILTAENLQKNPDILYFLIRRLIISISLFFTLFYYQKSAEEKNTFAFIRNIYILNLIIVALSVIFISLINVNMDNIYIKRFLNSAPILDTINTSLLLITTFIYINIELKQSKNLFTSFGFGIGLFTLAIGYISLNVGAVTNIVEFIAQLIRTLGYFLILTGLSDLNKLPKSISIRDKLLSYAALTLMFFYLIFIFASSIIFDIKFSSLANAFFLEFIMILSVVQVILFTRFITPVENIIKSIEKYTPEQKPEKIPISSNDEIGFLAEKLNTIIDENWNYTKKLLRKQTELTDKATALLKITAATKNIFDLNHILEIVCKELLNIFKADKALVASYKERFGNWEFSSECQNKINLPMLKNVQLSNETDNFIKKMVLDEGKDIIIEDLEKSDFPDYFKKTYFELNIKSMIIIPIKNENEIWGALGLFHMDSYRKWNKNEINFLHEIANQTFIALRQAELYSTTKNQADRAELIRETIEIIRSTLDADKIKKYFVEITRNYFDADRCLFNNYDKKLGLFLPFEIEKLKTPEIKSLVGIKITETFPEFTAKIKKGRNIIIRDVEKTYSRKKFNGYKSLETLYENGVKSDYGFSVKYKDECYGILIIHFTSKKKVLTHDELDFLKILRNQVGIALHQAELYTTVKNQANRETLLREIITVIRSSLDINETKKNIVNMIGKTFKADRCYFRSFDKKTEKFLSPDVEYLASSDIKSLINVEPNQEGLKYFLDAIKQQGKGSYPVVIDIDDIKGELVEKYFKYSEILVDYAIPLWDRDDNLAYLVLHYTKTKPNLDEEDKKLMETIAKQVIIAFDQSILFNTVKETAERERILSEIITNIKTSENLSKVYNYLVLKLAEIFNAERVIFIETQTFNSENSEIKYEYLKNNEFYSTKNAKLPKFLIKTLLQIEKSQQPFIVNNIKDFCKNKKEAQSYFKYFTINSILSIPLIRYNHEVKTLGVLVLCMSEPREWTQQEILLLKAIANSVVTIIWEITKLIEIDELKNTFILTLVHDIQIPLVDQQKTLEYLAARGENEPIGKYSNFINQTIESNKNLFKLLTKLLDSYQYQSGRKKLNFRKINMSKLINQTVKELSESINLKFITINISIEQNLPEVLVDENEVKIVFQIILENAINYTQENGNIEIKNYRENNNLITGISDNGPGITADMKDKIFNRHAFTQIIENEIGTGLGLFLAKQIIEAHNGEIWFETEEGIGSEFYFSLPIAEK